MGSVTLDLAAKGNALALQCAEALAVSIFSSNSRSISKLFGLNQAGELRKVNGGQLFDGTVKSKRFATVRELAEFANSAPPTLTLGFGVCGHKRAKLTTKARRELATGDKPMVSRSKDCFSFGDGPGVLHIDYDPRPGKPPMTPDELVAALRSAVPELEFVAMAVKSSSSAYIARPDGTVLKGAGGLHAFIPVEDARLIPELGRIIDQRLWLAGNGWMKITGNGMMLPTTCIDASVFSPERLCFCTARCEDGVSQTLPPVSYYPGGADDLTGAEGRLPALPALGEADQMQLAEMQRAARAAASDEADATRQSWAEARADEACAYAEKRGQSLDSDAIVRSFAGTECRVLPPDLILHLHEGDEVSVADLLRDRQKWNGKQMADPIEPDYGNDDRIAMAILEAGEPYIFSHAHGGQKYLLRTEDKRLAEIAEDFDDLDEAAPASECAADGPIHATPYDWPSPSAIPPREWLYGRHLLRGTLSAIVAPGATGKSAYTVGIALSLATGRSLLGKDVYDDPKTVWLYNLEDGRDELNRSIAAASLQYGITPADCGGRLFVNSGLDGQGLCTAVQTRQGFTILHPVYDAIVAELQARGIDCLIVDPFVSSQAVSENDNGAIDAVAKAWARVASAANCSIVLVHHTAKLAGGEVTAEKARGASAFVNAARSVVALNRMTPEEARKWAIPEGEHRRYFRAYDDKNNRAPPADASDWYRLESVSLCNGAEPLDEGDSVGVVVPWTPPSVRSEANG
jgi:RecA-family ATPase